MKEEELLFNELQRSWIQRNPRDFAACFANDGTLIAFDGTYVKRKNEIYQYVQDLFQVEQDLLYQSVPVELKRLTPTIVLFRCHTGKTRRQTDHIVDERMAHLTLLLQKKAVWEIVLMQYTPAPFETYAKIRHAFQNGLGKSTD